MGIHRIKNTVKAFNILIAATFLFSMIFPAPRARADAAMPLPQRGMCYITWDRNRFASPYSDESLAKLVSLGVEYVSICVTHYQDKPDSTKIKRTDKTPSERSLAHAIRQARNLGLKVMLKPHIDLIGLSGTYYRADIGFYREKDWQKWFKGYRKVILHYARMAERLGVEIFCVGTELAFASQKVSDWRGIIADVRKVYRGELVYAANWDNFKNIEFWQDLDYAGIDAYFPLTHKGDPSLEDLKNGWKRWEKDIEAWQARIKKPVIFTEIGYASTPHAARTPWRGGADGTADPEIQAKCYEAFFDTIWNRPWLAGVYWWKWDTNVRAGGKHNRQFTPQNKSAQKVIETNYKSTGKLAEHTIKERSVLSSL